MIKSTQQIDKLITYLNNKRAWIDCYAIRKWAGLRNSSNGVEGQNNENVADRQKHNRTSWCSLGSATLASLTSLFSNGEENEWFVNGNVNFKMQIDNVT